MIQQFVLFLDIKGRVMKYVYPRTCIQMVIAPLLPTARKWKLKYPSVGE